MSTLNLQGGKITVKAAIDRRFSPGTDHLMVIFGPLSMGLYRSEDRKAFIAALQDADAELDVAALRGKKEGGMKLTVVIQYYGHVIHAGGYISYRRVTVELTEQQIAALQLREDEDYGPMFIEQEEGAA